jgi:hypothetical protein
MGTDEHDVPEAVRRHPEFAKLMKDATPEVRELLCQFFREYERLTDEERAEVLQYGESLRRSGD